MNEQITKIGNTTKLSLVLCLCLVLGIMGWLISDIYAARVQSMQEAGIELVHFDAECNVGETALVLIRQESLAENPVQGITEPLPGIIRTTTQGRNARSANTVFSETKAGFLGPDFNNPGQPNVSHVIYIGGDVRNYLNQQDQLELSPDQNFVEIVSNITDSGASEIVQIPPLSGVAAAMCTRENVNSSSGNPAFKTVLDSDGTLDDVINAPFWSTPSGSLTELGCFREFIKVLDNRQPGLPPFCVSPPPIGDDDDDDTPLPPADPADPPPPMRQLGNSETVWWFEAHGHDKWFLLDDPNPYIDGARLKGWLDAIYPERHRYFLTWRLVTDWQFDGRPAEGSPARDEDD